MKKILKKLLPDDSKSSADSLTGLIYLQCQKLSVCLQQTMVIMQSERTEDVSSELQNRGISETTEFGVKVDIALSDSCTYNEKEI